jgi:hypothetical protein
MIGETIDLGLLSTGGPEGARWHPMKPAAPQFGYASFYYADDLAALPVRAVTRIRDNKSDPNLETGTYGLFSTCQAQMRAGCVKNSARYIFFFTRPRGQDRHLTGMYEIAAWAPGALGEAAGDFALAASSVRFIRPIAVSKLPDVLLGPLSTRWRLTKKLDHDQTLALVELIESRSDMTARYLAEIERLERINKFRSGYRYPTWLRGASWSWADAADYLKPPSKNAEGLKVGNSSPTGWWGCAVCNAAIQNGALLKACPECRELGTLRPLDEDQVARIVRAA